MADVSRRARDAAGAAAGRLRRVVEGSPLGGLLEDQQHNLNELLEQVQNTELRAKLMALYDQQQHAFVELAHTVQTNVTAQQQHLADVLAAVEDTIRARRARVEEADPVDDLSDDSEADEPPRAAPFADVPAAKDAPADFAPTTTPASPMAPAPADAPANVATPADFAPPADFSPPVTPTPPFTSVKPAKKSPAKKAVKKAAAAKKGTVSADASAPTPLEVAALAKKAAAKKSAKKPTQP